MKEENFILKEFSRRNRSFFEISIISNFSLNEVEKYSIIV